MPQNKPKLLLHICCAGCGVYVSRPLQENFSLTLFFYNPSLYPELEYLKRMAEAGKMARLYRVELIAEKYDHESWLSLVRGHEADPERGGRCRICYKDRLDSAARTAVRLKADYFTTTLTASPHKDAFAINEIGKKLAEEHGVKFLTNDFKKNSGFKKSSALSKELGLYRQNYCGCEFSVK